MFLSFLVSCLLVTVNSSLKPSFLASEGHRETPQRQEHMPVTRPVSQPAALPLQQKKTPLTAPSTNPILSVAKKPTINLSSKPVVTAIPKPSLKPYCVEKHYDSDEKEEDEEGVPCSTAPSLENSIKPTVSTYAPTIAPSNYPTAPLTEKPLSNPTVNPLSNPTVNPFPNPTVNPISYPTVTITMNPSVKPTFQSGESLVSFNTYLNFQFVDCNILRSCTACQLAIELSQQQVINSTLHRLANVTYIDCIVGRRRLSEMFRHLAISSNVTLITTFFSQNPIIDSDTAKSTVISSVKNGIYTTLVQENSLNSNATETKNSIVRSVVLGISNFFTTSPTAKPSKIPTIPPFSSTTILTSAAPNSYPPSIRPVAINSAVPSCKPSSNPSKQFTTQNPSVPPSKTIPANMTGIPSTKPSNKPSVTPTKVPNLSRNPSVAPSNKPSVTPTKVPNLSGNPSVAPSSKPSVTPSKVPSFGMIPSLVPSDKPSATPTKAPNFGKPSVSPSDKPSVTPSKVISPTDFPTFTPSFGCLVIQAGFIFDSQYSFNSNIECVVVPSTVTSIGIVISTNYVKLFSETYYL